MLQETRFDYEIVIGEDCSTDRTREIVINYQKRYPDKIKLLLSKENKGITHNFIQTTNACRGQYIALCEGDDYWTEPSKLQKQVDFLDANPEFSMCAHGVMVKYEDGRKGDENFKKLDTDVYFIEDVIRERLFATNSLLFRRNSISELPEWFGGIISADRALLILVASKGRIKYLNEAMGVYRKHKGGISSYGDVRAIFLSDIYLFRKVNAHFGYKYDKIIKSVILNRHKQILDYYIKTNNRIESTKIIIKLFSLSIRSGRLDMDTFVKSLYSIFIPARIKWIYRYIKKVRGIKIKNYRYY